MPINNVNINLLGNFDAQNDGINFQETFMFICMQKKISSLTSFLTYCKDQACYFGNFGNA